jgi:hypothetical protein
MPEGLRRERKPPYRHRPDGREARARPKQHARDQHVAETD